MAFLIDRLPQLGAKAAYTLQAICNKLTEHREYIRTYGQDMPEVRDWKWSPVRCPRSLRLPSFSFCIAPQLLAAKELVDDRASG